MKLVAIQLKLVVIQLKFFAIQFLDTQKEGE